MLEKVLGGSAWKTNVGKAAWELRGKLILEKVAVEVHGQMMLEKVPGEVRGKIMLEKVPGKLLRKLNVGKSAWRARLQTAGRVIDKVFRGHNVTSLKLKRRQCRLQLGVAMNLVLHISLHISAKSSHAMLHFAELSRFVQNVAIYAL